MLTMTIEERLDRARDVVRAAAGRGGFDPDRARIVAVTKGHPFSAVEAALAVGLRDLGENRIDALIERAGRVAREDVRWHMIGRLQRRSAPGVHGVAALVHSIDSSRIAGRLGDTAPEGTPPLPVLVQVSTTGEETKAGIRPDEAVDQVGRMLEMGALRIDGLMTMAPFTDEEPVLRSAFGALRELGERLHRELPAYRGKELSMGMSNDYQVAVEEGSTMVRLGTVLFGERKG